MKRETGKPEAAPTGSPTNDSGQRDGVSFATFHIPDDPEFLSAVGRIALRHVHLDHTLRLLIKTLAGLTVREARLATAGESSSILRDHARKLGKRAIGEGRELLRLRALLRECKHVTGERNDLLHSICAQELNTATIDEPAERRAMLLDESLGSRELPSIEQLRRLENEIAHLVDTINHERRFGFIAEAMMARKPGRLASANRTD